MPAPPQIKANMQWVIDNFGPQSDLPQFGLNAESVAYLDSFMDRQGQSFLANEQGANRIVSLLGAFVGEAIIAEYGGEWQQSPEGLTLSIKRGDQIHIIQPFQKVHKRLMNGPDDSLQFYFSTFLPQVLSQSASGESHPQPRPDDGAKKPWWKFF